MILLMICPSDVECEARLKAGFFFFWGADVPAFPDGPDGPDVPDGPEVPVEPV